MTEDQMNRARQEGFLNKFKLTTTLSTANMRLLDANGELKKYDTPEQILEDFFHLRLDFCEKRRTAQLRKLKKAELLLENKARFVGEVLKREIVFHPLIKGKDELCAELKSKCFKSLLSIERAAEYVGREETEEEEEVAAGEEKPHGHASETVPGTGYDYLLMAFRFFSYEKMEELEQERDAKNKEFDELTNTDSESLWVIM